MRLTYHRIAVISGVMCLAMLFTSAATTAQAASSTSRAGESRLSGSAVTISVAIPVGWHQLVDQSDPDMLQMVWGAKSQPVCLTWGISVLAVGA